MKTKAYRVLCTKDETKSAVKSTISASLKALSLIEIGSSKAEKKAIENAKGSFKWNPVNNVLEVTSQYPSAVIIEAIENNENYVCHLLVKAFVKHVRISPRKVQIVLNLIRGKNVATALAILKNTNKGASEYLIKLVNSAVANAENNFGMDASELFISDCFVTAGPTLKRIMPRAKGSADRILKRTSHITVVVEEKN